MATELFQYTVTYSNGFYRINEFNNDNLIIQFPLAQTVIAVDQNNANYFTIGTSANRVTLNYTLCTNVANPTRQTLIDNIIALAITVPPYTDIIGESRTNSTGTLTTIPIGRVFFGHVALSACIAGAGNCNPTISVTPGTGVAPSGIILQIQCTGLANLTTANSNMIGNVYIHGGQVGAVVTFTAGAAGNTSGQIVGRLL